MRLSYWEQEKVFENLDYIIVGAGIVGSFTAYFLNKLQPQAKILIVDRGVLPLGASTKNAGFACFGSITEMMDDLESIDENALMQIIKMRVDGLNLLKQIVPPKEMQFDQCGGYEVVKPSTSSITHDHIQHFNKLVKSVTGLEKTFAIRDDPFNTNFDTNFIFNQFEGKLHPVRMLHYLHNQLTSNGVNFIFGTMVNKIEKKLVIASNLGEAKFNIHANKILLCNNAFANSFLKEDIKPARNNVLVTQRIPNLKLNGTFHFDKGYVYFRNIENRILIGGARNLDADQETTNELGFNDKIINQLKDILSTYILPGTDPKIEYQWSGIMGVGSTKKPIIKQISPHLYAGIRLGGMGVAIGSLVGKELANLASK